MDNVKVLINEGKKGISVTKPTKEQDLEIDVIEKHILMLMEASSCSAVALSAHTLAFTSYVNTIDDKELRVEVYEKAIKCLEFAKLQFENSKSS